MILHLGVAEFPYAVNVPPAMRRVSVRVRRRGGKAASPPEARSHAPSGGQTTADVARFLEAKYHVMEVFYNINDQKIADRLTETLKDEIDNMMMGASPNLQPFAAGTSQIEDWFKQFLALQDIEKLGIPGVPTKAALAGINHRKKNPKTGVRRPSFIDTSQYQASFKSWTE